MRERTAGAVRSINWVMVRVLVLSTAGSWGPREQEAGWEGGHVCGQIEFMLMRSPSGYSR